MPYCQRNMEVFRNQQTNICKHVPHQNQYASTGLGHRTIKCSTKIRTFTSSENGPYWPVHLVREKWRKTSENRITFEVISHTLLEAKVAVLTSTYTSRFASGQQTSTSLGLSNENTGDHWDAHRTLYFYTFSACPILGKPKTQLGLPLP